MASSSSTTTRSRRRQKEGDDDKLTLIMPESKSARLQGFKDGGRKRTKAMELERTVPPPVVEESDDEYEEEYIYVALDDIPSVDELFAVEPDDFLTCQSRRQREIVKPPKPLCSQLQLKFYNLDSPSPVLQIGSRYYSGVYEEPMGSCLMFQDKSSASNVPSSSRTATKNVLASIVPEMIPPKDKVFGESVCSSHGEYQLVANVHKVLKMTRKEVHFHGEEPAELPPTPSGEPAPMPLTRWPPSYSTTEVFSGKYHADRRIPGGPFFHGPEFLFKSIIETNIAESSTGESVDK